MHKMLHVVMLTKFARHIINHTKLELLLANLLIICLISSFLPYIVCSNLVHFPVYSHRAIY